MSKHDDVGSFGSPYDDERVSSLRSPHSLTLRISPVTSGSPTSISPTTYSLDSPPSNELAVVAVSLSAIMLGMIVLPWIVDLIMALCQSTFRLRPTFWLHPFDGDWVMMFRNAFYWFLFLWWSLTFAIYAAATGGAPYQTPVHTLLDQTPLAQALLSSACMIAITPVLLFINGVVAVYFPLKSDHSKFSGYHID